MLKKDTIKALKALGFDVDKLTAAVKAEDEQDFELPTINNLTDDQLAERDKQVIAAAKPDLLKEGKQTGIEIANKAIAKKFNLTDVDTKDPDKLIVALEGSVAKGDNGLKEQIALLQKDKLTLEQAIESEKNNAKALQFDTELIGYFPPNRTADLSDRERLALIKMNLEFAEDNGTRVVKRDGQVLRDKTTQAPLPTKDVIATLFNEKKWISSGGGGGRGGDDNLGGGGKGIKTFSQAEAQFLKDNPDGNVMSPAFTNYVNAIAKESPEFNYDA